MVNVIPNVEPCEVNNSKVVINVQGRVDIRLHGTVISEEVDIGNEVIVDNEVDGEMVDIDSVELDPGVQGAVVNSVEGIRESNSMDAGVKSVTEERDDRVDDESVTKERDRVDSESETKERDRVDAESETKERDRVDSKYVTKEKDYVVSNGVSAKVLAEQNSEMGQKASKHPQHSHQQQRNDYQQQHWSMDETGLSSNGGCLSGMNQHTPTCLTLIYKPSALSPQVVKYFPKQAIVRAKGESVSFGRSRSSDIELNDDCMSRNYAVLWLPVGNRGTFKLYNCSPSKEVVVDNILLHPKSNSKAIFSNNSKIILDNIEFTAMVRQGHPESKHYEVKIEPTICRSTSLQQEPTWISSSRNVGATAHQTDHIVSTAYRRSMYAHSKYHSAGPVEHGITNEISRNLLPEEHSSFCEEKNHDQSLPTHKLK